jgi:hypothetical protein
MITVLAAAGTQVLTMLRVHHVPWVNTSPLLALWSVQIAFQAHGAQYRVRASVPTVLRANIAHRSERRQ